MAATELFRARWTDAIHDEWIRNVLKNRPDLTREQLRWTRERMDASVIDCLVSGYEHLTPTINLPDPDDRHVVAAAAQARADAIITFNLKDFPLDDTLEKQGLPKTVAALRPYAPFLSQWPTAPRG
ncbi:PIN domain-containing protein [Nitrospirillum sp. BR 11164]|uniref:PIN domain-containing protein n=1 Tax=Nitrospirillum sp. BR 11164 TaxID=3104324 RepID=UPI002AFE67D4|nr:PIN domain-containing protein [Nitrospirillum sp. BR 11164]MEA1653118.1 PIN domain-containing protein [Nitrospirillum sp. BR 11164]